MQSLIDYLGDNLGIDRTQIVMNEYVPKPADLPPRNIAEGCLQPFGEALSGFGKRLKVSQCCVVQNVVTSNITARFDAANFRDGVKNVERVGLPGLRHRSMASRST